MNFIKLCINVDIIKKKGKNRRRILEITGSNDWSVKKNTHTHDAIMQIEWKKRIANEVLRLRGVNR